MPIEFVFIIGIAVLMFLCLKVKASAFISLLATALVMGLLAGMPGPDVVGAITSGFAGTVESIGIVIIFGIMLGNYLDAAKGTNRMALDTVKLVGQKRASLAAGLLSTHVYVPPTPGPLAAAGLLGIDIGRAILYGAFAAVFMTLFGWIFVSIYLRNKPESFYTFRDDAEQAAETAQSAEDLMDESKLPGTLASLLPLVIPILLIIANTTCSMLLPEDSPILSVSGFIGDANAALAIGVVLSIILLGRRLGGKAVLKIMDDSLKDAGPIVFITAAGGALGEVLQVSGAGDSLANGIVGLGLPFILVPFVISAILKVVQGSGTVAVNTAATHCAPIAASLGLDPVLIFLASGAGARACCHVNDSFYWVYTNCMGFDMKTGLKTLSVSNVAMSLGGLFATFLCSLWL